MSWIALTLLCAFCLASADAATKYWLRDAATLEIAALRLGYTALLLAPLWLAVQLPALPAPFWAWLGMLIPLELLAMLLYVRAIRDHELSLTLPYLAFTPVFVVVTGWLVLGESVSGIGAAGVVLVVFGSWLLPARAAGDPLAPLRAMWTHRGARLMLGAAAIYSLTSVGGKAAMQWMPAAQFGPFYFGVLGVATLVLIGLMRPASLPIVWRRPGAGLIVGGLTAAMVFTHFLALERVEAAYMIALKRSSLLFGILYGALLFREPELRRHLLAGMLMIAGVALVLLH